MSSVQNSTEYSSQNNSVVLDEYDDADEEETSLADQSPSHYSSDALPQDNSVDGTFDGSMTSQLDNESVNTSRRTDNDSRGEGNDASGQALRYRNRRSRRQEQEQSQKGEERQQSNRQPEITPSTRPSSLSPSTAVNAPNEIVSNVRRPVTSVRSVSRDSSGSNKNFINRRVIRTPSRESSVNEQTVNSTLNYTVTSYNSPSSARTPSYVDEQRTLGESQEYYYEEGEEYDDYEYDYTHGDDTENATHLTTHNGNDDSANITTTRAKLAGGNAQVNVKQQPRRVNNQRDAISSQEQEEQQQQRGQLGRQQRPEQRSLSESQLTYEQYDNSYEYNDETELYEEEQYSSEYGSMTYEDSALRSPRSASERSATFASFYYTNPTLQRVWEQAYFLRRPIFFIVCATTGNTFISLLSTLLRSVHKQTHIHGNELSDKALDALRRQPSETYNGKNHNAQKVKAHPQVTEINNTNTRNIISPTAEGGNTQNVVNNKITETIKGETIVAPMASAVEELPSGYPNVPEWLREIRASLPSVVEKPVAWCLRKSNIPVLSELQQAQLEQNAKQLEQQQQLQQVHEIVNDAPSAPANEELLVNHINDIDSKNYVDVDDVNHAAEETSAMVPAALFVPILSLTILIIAKCIIARQNHENALLLESAADYEDEDVDNLDTSNNIYMTSLDDKVDGNNMYEGNTDNNSTSMNNYNNNNNNTISASARNGAKIPPTESMVTLTEDNTFADSTNANIINANIITGGNVMNDYLKAHVSETTQGINNNNNSNNKENKAVGQVEQQEEQQEEDKERQISEGENVSEGIVNTADNLNNNKMLITESLAVEVDNNNNIRDNSILANDDENTLTDELLQTNNNASMVANRRNNSSSTTTTTNRRSHRSVPVERVKSPSPETSASALASAQPSSTNTEINSLNANEISNSNIINSNAITKTTTSASATGRVVNNVMEHAIPRPMTSRFALKGEVVAALVGNPSINEVNVLLVAATRYECARVFLSENLRALPNIINTPVWLNVQFVNNVIDTISETALLHGLRRVGVFAQPVQNTPHSVNNELIPLPRFRHPANALYVFIAHTTLPQGQRNDAMREYDKLANTVLASTESHVFSGPAHGEAGIPVNECFYDRLQKERQAERVNVAAAIATNAEVQQMEKERLIEKELEQKCKDKS